MNKSVLILLLLGSSFISCKKSTSSPNTPSSTLPEVLTLANNTKAFGRYTGVFTTGSNYGIYKIDLRNSNSTAVFKRTGYYEDFNLEGVGAIQDGVNVSDFIFRSVYPGANEFKFNVNSNGDSPNVNLITNNYLQMSLITSCKEYTNAQPAHYIGFITKSTYSGSSQYPVCISIDKNGKAQGGFVYLSLKQSVLPDPVSSNTYILRVILLSNPPLSTDIYLNVTDTNISADHGNLANGQWSVRLQRIRI